jgi:hypothetical protein
MLKVISDLCFYKANKFTLFKRKDIMVVCEYDNTISYIIKRKYKFR